MAYRYFRHGDDDDGEEEEEDGDDAMKFCTAPLQNSIKEH
jgi:hypothetical protein